MLTIMAIDLFLVFGMILHTTAYTAGEGIEGVAEALFGTHPERDEISHHACTRML